ncbi:MAG: hypothetical protein OSJ46_06275 [Duncaniella sp.]|nr:hypothetical protein [Duncaniella sp.]
MKTNIKFYTLLAVIFGACLYGLYLYFGRIDFGLVFLAIFGTIITFLIIAAVIGIIWRAKNGVDMLATLETDPEKVKEHMLFIMQFGHTEGIKGALNEFNDIFRNYPQWELEKWEVFRAWYKDLIDRALENPEIYNLTMKDGSEYTKEADPLYDPDALSWEQFDRKRYYDDDDDDDDDDNNDTPDLKKAAKDGFMRLFKNKCESKARLHESDFVMNRGSIAVAM